MMRRLVYLFFVIIIIGVASCENPTPEEMASLAAKGYYEHLAAGEYDAYLQGVAGCDSAPEDYVAQLRLGAQQYVQRCHQLHRGISEVRVSSVKADSTLRCTQVFLLLSFADSTHEEVCVPMVEQNGKWRMR